MFTRRLHIFDLAGFPVRLDLSWFLVVALITWSLAQGSFPQNYPGLSAVTYWAMGLAAALGLFGSILLHELGHAVVARRNDLPIDGITLFVFGGVAEMTREPRSARAEFFVAIGGPVVTLVLIVLFAAASIAIESADGPAPLYGILWYLALVNGLVLVFNLIPAFPLDGGRVLRAILWDWRRDLVRATRITSTLGSIFGMVLIALGVLAFLSGNVIGGIWQVFIGMFLRGAARSSYQQVVLRQNLEGVPVSRFMKWDVITVTPEATIAALVDEYIAGHRHPVYPVVDGDRLLGWVSFDELRRVPRVRWAEERVTVGLHPVDRTTAIGPDEDAVEALARMRQSGSPRLLVTEGERLLGIVTLQDISDFLELAQRGGGAPDRPRDASVGPGS